LTAVLVHVALYYHQQLIDNFRAASHHQEDIHVRLNRRYPEVPDWWYYTLFLMMMFLSIVVCEAWDTRLPWWGFLVTQLIPFIFTLPIGMVQAITNVQIGKLYSLTRSLMCRIECDYRVCGWVYASWKTTCKYDDQNIWVYDDVPRTFLCGRLKTWLLHESSSSGHVQNPTLVYCFSVLLDRSELC